MVRIDHFVCFLGVPGGVSVACMHESENGTWMFIDSLFSDSVWSWQLFEKVGFGDI